MDKAVLGNPISKHSSSSIGGGNLSSSKKRKASIGHERLLFSQALWFQRNSARAMRPLPIPKTASQVMKNFRARELEGLMCHLRLHGPLPTQGTPDSPSTIVLPNPFIPRKNPRTGKWRDPKYSLRRQADLVKRAKELGELATMPPGPKLFAMELRFKRLQTSLSPTDAAIVRKTVGSTLLNAETASHSTNTQTPVGEANSKPEKDLNRISVLEVELQKRKDEFRAFEEDLETRQTQHELDDLAAFEKNETEAERKERRQRQGDYISLEGEIVGARQEIVKAAQNLENAQKHKEALEAEKARERLWSNPLWVGEVKRKPIRGEELGIKLYAGKKRMFKGHLWEKQKAKKLRRQSMLMRDMKARVERYKSYYKKRKPNPLRPSRLSKPPKLPF